MTVVECRDGTRECIGNLTDLTNLVRDKLGDEVADLFSEYYDIEWVFSDLKYIINKHKDFYKKAKSVSKELAEAYVDLYESVEWYIQEESL